MAEIKATCCCGSSFHYVYGTDIRDGIGARDSYNEFLEKHKDCKPTSNPVRDYTKYAPLFIERSPSTKDPLSPPFEVYCFDRADTTFIGTTLHENPYYKKETVK